MADLYIDGEALAATKSNLSDIEDLLKGPCNKMSDLPVEAAGHEELKGRLNEFGDQWDYGIGKLGDFSGACVDALTTIGDTFSGLDDELAKCFDQGQQ